MKLRILPIITLCTATLAPLAILAQTAETAETMPQQHNTDLFNTGSIETGYPQTQYTNNPYTPETFREGSLCINGYRYDHVMMRIDAYRKNLIVLSSDGKVNLCYGPEKVSQVMMDGHPLVYLTKNDDAPAEGWYEVLGRNSHDLLMQRVRVANIQRVVNRSTFVLATTRYRVSDGRWRKIGASRMNALLTTATPVSFSELAMEFPSLEEAERAALPQSRPYQAIVQPNGKATPTDGQIARKVALFSPLYGAEAHSALADDEHADMATSENLVYAVGQATPQASGRVTLKGRVFSAKTGQPIKEVNLLIRDPWVNVMTDDEGGYTMEVPRGHLNLEISGFNLENTRRQLLVNGTGRLDIEIQDADIRLGEAHIVAGRIDNVKDTRMGVHRLTMEEMQTIPTSFGELDVMQVVAKLPGVKTMGEGSNGLSVRGGATDQNLILFNDNTIYNPSHLFGMFSAFNGAVVKDMELYKCNIPAKFGGRVSSVLDINSKRGSRDGFTGNVTLGLLTSSAVLDIPLKKDKTSLILGGRATYSDWILRVLPEKSGYRDGSAEFYDANLILNHQFTPVSSLSVSGYYSRDRFSFKYGQNYAYQNINGVVKFTHLLNEESPLTVSAGIDHYDYDTSDKETVSEAYDMQYGINQYFLRLDYLNKHFTRHRFGGGLDSKVYDVQSGKLEPIGISLYTAQTLPTEQALEAALYASEEYDFTEKFSGNVGVRLNLFGVLGSRTVNVYEGDGLPSMLNKTGTETVGSLSQVYVNPDFRASLRYAFTPSFSIKAGVANMHQYIHRLSNTLVASPTDIWKLSDTFIRPQNGIQYSLGLYKNLENDNIEISLEGYYKTLSNYLDYRSGAQLIMNPHLETDVITTRGRAYGVELMVKRNEGKLNGWVSYTYSRTQLQQNDPNILHPVNNGAWYSADYDKPHEIKLVGNYRFTKRYSLSVNMDYSTGRPLTLPVARSFNGITGGYVFYYSDRNVHRMPDYFRMDVAFNVMPTHHLTSKLHTFFTIGCYNVTARRNAYSIYYKNENGAVKGYKLSVIGCPIPYISINTRF